MELIIRKIYKATEEEWSNVWENCNYSTYFHSKEWADVWRMYTKGNIVPEPKLIEFSDGKTAILTLSKQKIANGILKKWLSSPGGTFGGWISMDELGEDHCLLLLNYFMTKLGSVIYRINPYDKNLLKLTHGIGKKDNTNLLYLGKEFKKIFKMGSKGHRSAYTKAMKAGITVRSASAQENWEDYYKVYEDSLRRWGKKTSSKYEKEFFVYIENLKTKNIQLWIAEYENTVVAGALCLYSKNHVVYWHGAALEKYFKLRPVNYLIYEMIRNACECGYKIFDFNPSGGHKGVEAFKKSFGTTTLLCPVINIQKPAERLFKKIARLKNRIAK